MVSRRQFLRGNFSSPPARVDGGRAVITRDCLAYNNVVCRTCGEACEAAAIRFRPRLGGAAVPEVDEEKCTGCGACLAPCPAKAIALV